MVLERRDEMKWIFLLFLPVVTFASTYCVKTKFSNHCSFNDANECRQEAERRNGICVANDEAPASVYPSNRASLQSAFSNLGDLGNAIEESRESEAREAQTKQSTELIRLQTEAIRIKMSADSLEFERAHPGEINPYYRAPEPIRKRKTIADNYSDDSGAFIFLGAIAGLCGVLGIILIAQN